MTSKDSEEKINRRCLILSGLRIYLRKCYHVLFKRRENSKILREYNSPTANKYLRFLVITATILLSLICVIYDVVKIKYVTGYNSCSKLCKICYTTPI